MSWANIDLTTISPTLEIIPEKMFTWELLPGATYDERDHGRINVSAAIVNDGEFSGRKIFFSYPDPEGVSPRSGKKQDWSAIALKRLEQAIGVDYEAGEDPVHFLNRAAGSRFMSGVQHSKPTDEYPNPRANLNLLNVRPSA